MRVRAAVVIRIFFMNISIGLNPTTLSHPHDTRSYGDTVSILRPTETNLPGTRTRKKLVSQFAIARVLIRTAPHGYRPLSSTKVLPEPFPVRGLNGVQGTRPSRGQLDFATLVFRDRPVSQSGTVRDLSHGGGFAPRLAC